MLQCPRYIKICYNIEPFIWKGAKHLKTKILPSSRSVMWKARMMTSGKVGSVHAAHTAVPAGPKDQSSTVKLTLTTCDQISKHYTEDRFPQTFLSSFLSSTFPLENKCNS